MTRPPSAPWCDKESKASTRPSDSSIMYPNKRMCQCAGVRDHPIWVLTVFNLIKTTGPADNRVCSAHAAELLYTQNINQAHSQTYTHHRSWKEENCPRSQSRNLRLLMLYVTKFNCFSSIKPECFHTHQCMSPKYAGFCEIARKNKQTNICLLGLQTQTTQVTFWGEKVYWDVLFAFPVLTHDSSLE